MPATKAGGSRSSGPRPVAHARKDKTEASVTRILNPGNLREAIVDAVGEYVSPRTAGARWEVSESTIMRLIDTGQLRGYRLNNRIVRVRLADVDRCFHPIAKG